MIRNFNLEIERSVDLDTLGWPERGTAGEDGLRCNRAYIDLRGLSWVQSQAVLALDARFINILQSQGDFDSSFDQVKNELEELYDEGDEGLFGLDLGVASSVVALSAARCIPFSSCNGGAFGDHHEEAFPLVSFFVKPAWVSLLLEITTTANVGLYNSGDGLVVYGEILDMLSFAKNMHAGRSLFNRLKLTSDNPITTSKQIALPF
jgi:hypothetical protein